MAKENAAVAAYENPLIPNARLRQLYRAMLRTRLLARALPGGRGSSVPGREACLVSTSVDLGQGDLVSDALTGPVMEFLRGAGLATVVRGEKASSKRGVSTDCAAAVQLPFAGGSAERIWLALGAAATLKAQAARARIEHQATDAEKTSQSVVVLYTLPGELAPALWRKALALAVEQVLPVIFVVLPVERAGSGKGQAAKVGGVGTVALECGVPAIAVDQDDAVAIYRVVQESIGRARIGGGAALIECVPFAVAGSASKRSSPIDGILVLERYLLQRRVASKVWLEQESKSFAKQIAREKAAST